MINTDMILKKAAVMSEAVQKQIAEMCGNAMEALVIMTIIESNLRLVAKVNSKHISNNPDLYEELRSYSEELMDNIVKDGAMERHHIGPKDKIITHKYTYTGDE